MKENVSDFLVRRLSEWGIKRIFGFPGDGINGIMEALRVRQDKVSFVQVRHEESAAFMACGYAKYTGSNRRVPRYIRSRRHPPAQWPLRRQARSRAGPRDHRPDVPRSDRDAVPAGGRSAVAVRRCFRVQPDDPGRLARPGVGRCGMPRRAVASERRSHHHSRGFSGTGGRCVFLGNPECGVALAPIDFVKFADSCGAN